MMQQANIHAAVHLEELPDKCLEDILFHLPWGQLRRVVPLVSKRLCSAAAGSCSSKQLSIVLQQDSKLDSIYAWLQTRARRLHSLGISWWASQHLQQLQLVLQALTPPTPAGMQLPLRLQQLVLHVHVDATGAPLCMVAALLAETAQLRRLELRPVYVDTEICSSTDSDASAAAVTRLLDTTTLRGLSALAFNSLPPALALTVAQHSNLRQLLSLELRAVRWVELPQDSITTSIPRQPRNLMLLTKARGATPEQLLAAIGSNMPQLRELSLSHTARMEASPAAFRQLAAALTQLTALDVSFCPLLFNTEEEEEEAAAAAGEGPKGDLVMQMQQLRSLKVCRTSSSLLDFAAISQATALTHLAAGGDRDDDPGHWFTQIPDTQHLPLMQRLRRLELSSCSYDSLAAAAVAQLTQLTSINFSNSIVSLGVIEALGSCSGLIELNLCTLQSGFRGRAPGPAVAAAWAHLSGLTALTMLNVSGHGCNANFSAGLLVPLARACGSRLRVLLLDACVKQPGELAVLLPACTGLAALDLSHSGCRFSTDDLSALAGPASHQM